MPVQYILILRASSHVVLAIDGEPARVIGFINAISDGFHTAFIPMLEVQPAYRNRGIASALVGHMLTALEGFYAIDLACDADLCSFYERFNFTKATAMSRRDYARQSCGASVQKSVE